ncbi:MAG: DUF748 domain-containing protein [Campylobacterota bacterium]|nr:DUF748 domain-containing protein [Campylobacterota bacterium]
MIKIIKSIYFKVLFTLILTYSIIGFIVIPFYIVNNSAKLIENNLGTNGFISKIYFNPYTFYLEVNELLIYDVKNRPLIYFSTLHVDLEPHKLFDKIVNFKFIEFDNLSIDISILKDKKFNFYHILEKFDSNETESESSEASAIAGVKIDEFILDETRASFVDNSLADPFEVHTKEFHFEVENLSTIVNESGEINLNINTSETGAISTNAQLVLSPLDIKGEFSATNLNINKLFSYIKQSVDFRVAGDTINANSLYDIRYDDGKLKATLRDTIVEINRFDFENNSLESSFKKLQVNSKKIEYDTTSTHSLKVADTSLHVKQIRYKDSLNSANISDFNTTLTKLTQDNKSDLDIGISTVSLERLNFLNRDKKLIDLKQISLNSLHVVPSLNSYHIKSVNVDRLDTIVRLYRNSKTDFDYLVSKSKSNKKADENRESNETIDLKIDAINLANSSLLFKDYSHKKKVTLKFKNIASTLERFTLDEEAKMPFKLSLNTPLYGTLTTDATLSIKPLHVDALLKSRSINLRAYEPYIQRFVNLNLEKGYLNTYLKITLDGSKKDISKVVNGNLTFNKIALNHKLTKGKIANIKKLSIKNMKLDDSSVIIKSITIDEPYVKIAIDENKSTNLDNIAIQKSSSKPKEKTKEKPFNALVAKVAIKNGSSDFSDFSLPLKFKTHIEELKGDIYAVSTKKDAVTNFNLDGVIDRYGQSVIKGGITASEPFKHSELNVAFDNIDVSSFSPYSSKFIGHKIKTGKLWLELDYKIKNSELVSTNHMKLKDLELGEEVASPDAINAPIGLAIALLQDGDGFINVEVPIDGDVNSPEFHFGGAILSAITNVITSIVSAPFRMLGSLLGDDSDDLGAVEFRFGSAEILPAQKEKLDKLTVAIKKRPELTLVLTPSYDSLRDTYELKNLELANTFLKEFDENDNISSKYDFISNKYEESMGKKSLEKEQKFFETYLSKDDNFEEKLSNYLIEKMVQNTKLPPSALDNLATSRINNIKHYLEKQGFESSKIILTNKVEEFDEKSKFVNFKMKLDTIIK